MKIVVTGSSSHLASVLLPLLCEINEITLVEGIDVCKGDFQHRKFKENILDIRDPNIATLMHRCDCVIHLAFIVLRSTLGRKRKNRELIFDINVNGSINVFQSAAAQSVKTIIHLSSAVVYGAWPENPDAIKETQKRKVMSGFSYAEDKNKVEDWLDKFEQRNQIAVIRLRPHVILGPKSQPFLLSLIKQPFYPRLPDPQPLLQCIWESDVADAIVKSIHLQSSSILNLAADPPISFKQMIQLSHKISIPVPMTLLKFIHQSLWKISSIGEEPGWLNGMPYPLIIDASKAKKELDWTVKYSTEECIKNLQNKLM